MHSILDIAKETYPGITICHLDFIKSEEHMLEQIKSWKDVNQPVLIYTDENYELHKPFVELAKREYEKFAFTTPGLHKDDNHIPNIDPLTMWSCDPSQPRIDHDVDKKYRFIFLVGKLHLHRLDLLKSLGENKMLDGMLLSLDNRHHSYAHLLPKKQSLPEEYEWPEIVKLGGFEIWTIGSPVDQAWQKYMGKVHTRRYQDSAISIVSETNIDADINYCTEKTWIPIVAEHLMVHHGNRNNIQYLEELGFVINSNMIEPYDESDHEKVADACVELSSKDIKSLYRATEKSRQQNRQLALNESHWIDYHKQQLKKYFG